MFFALFWNGIVSVFVSLAAAAVYYQMFGPVPEWFPTPGLKNGQPIMNDKVMGVGETAFLCLFLTPFVIIGTGVAFNALLRLCGSTTITLNNYESIVSTGALFFRWSKKFDAQKVQEVKTVSRKFQQEGRQSQLIEIVSKKSIKFGRFFSLQQKDWVLILMKLILLQKQFPKGVNPPRWLK
jgi:hypothetical protein